MEESMSLSHFQWQTRSLCHMSQFILHGHIHSEGSLFIYKDESYCGDYIVMMSESIQMDIHQSVWKKFWYGLAEWTCRGRVKEATGR